jgi:signal peptidase I
MGRVVRPDLNFAGGDEARRCIARLLLMAVLVLGTVACGGGSNNSGGSSGSPPVEHVSAPKYTGYHMPSSSMEPTIHCAKPEYGCEASHPDRLLVRPTAAPRRGDLIVFTIPPAGQARCGVAAGVFLKRLIGLPGERWAEKRGYVYINGKRLNEPYLKPDRRDTETHEQITIPKGTYFLMGDNRAFSCDSRVWGPLPREKIIGKVVKIYRQG